MGDIRSTSNNSIWDENNSYTWVIDSDGEGNTKTKLWDGTNEVDVLQENGTNRLAVDSITVGSSSGITGDDINFHTIDTYASNETKDLWNYVVPVGKIAYIHALVSSSSKSGASRNKLTLVKDDGAETDVGGYFFSEPFQELYPKAVAFVAGETIIIRVTNAAGNNNEITASALAVEVDI